MQDVRGMGLLAQVGNIELARSTVESGLCADAPPELRERLRALRAQTQGLWDVALAYEAARVRRAGGATEVA